MAQLVDIYGRPLKREALKPRSRSEWRNGCAFIRPPVPWSEHQKTAAHSGSCRTRLSSAQAMLFADMEERDGHLFAEMEKRKKALLTLDWSVEPPRNASKAEKELAAAVDEWLHGIPDMEDIILNGMSSVGYGFSCQEISWAFVDKTWLPDAVTLRPHNWFITLPEHNDELRLDDGNRGEDGKDGSALWPFGWLVHRYNAPVGISGFIRPVPRTGLAVSVSKTLRCVIWRNFWRFTAFRRALRTMHRAPVTRTGTTSLRRWSIWVMKRWQPCRRVTKSSSRRPRPADRRRSCRWWNGQNVPPQK